MAGTGEVVQAAPDELTAFGSLCLNKASEATTSIDQVIAAVNSLQGEWEGLAADKFGAEWGRWQGNMKKFPEETTKTGQEMNDLAKVYELMDQQAKTAMEGVDEGTAASSATRVAAGVGTGAATGAAVSAARQAAIEKEFSKALAEDTMAKYRRMMGSGGAGKTPELRPSAGTHSIPELRQATGPRKSIPELRRGTRQVFETPPHVQDMGALYPGGAGGGAAGGGPSAVEQLDRLGDVAGYADQAADVAQWSHGLDIGFGGSATLKILSGKDYSGEGLTVALGEAALEGGVALHPAGVAAIAANSGAQLVGKIAISGGTEAAKVIASPEYDRLLESNQLLLNQSLERIDVTEVSKGAIRVGVRSVERTLGMSTEPPLEAFVKPATEAMDGATDLPALGIRQVAITGHAAYDRIAGPHPPPEWLTRPYVSPGPQIRRAAAHSSVSEMIKSFPHGVEPDT